MPKKYSKGATQAKRRPASRRERVRTGRTEMQALVPKNAPHQPGNTVIREMGNAPKGTKRGKARVVGSKKKK